MSFLEWQNDYHNKSIIYLISEFTKDEISQLEKLGITMEDKIYTEYEYESIKLELGKYYIEEGMDEEELENVDSLDDKNVSREEYNKILKKFDEIDRKYQDKFNKFKIKTIAYGCKIVCFLKI